MVSDLFEHLRQSAAPLISPIGTPQPKELEAVVRAMANVAQEWVAEQSIAPKAAPKNPILAASRARRRMCCGCGPKMLRALPALAALSCTNGWPQAVSLPAR